MKRNRIISISAVLLLAMALLTVQAWAANDWICPQCGKRVREIVGDICPYCGYERHVHDWLPATCVSSKTCRTCGETEGEPDPANHTGETEVRNQREATCEEAGYTGDTCCAACGQVLAQGRMIPAAGHRWESLRVIREATCIEQGLQECVCTVCGRTEERVLPVDPAMHTGATKLRDNRPATCGAAGYTGDTYCLDCGKRVIKGRELPATDRHDWQPATCTAPKTCRVCDMTEGAPAGHQWDKGRMIHPATCQVEGVIRYTCAACGETRTEILSVDPTAHRWDDGNVLYPATCTAEGMARYTCTVCGATETRVLPLEPSHHAGGQEVRNALEASCEESGYTGDIYCAACGAKISDGILVSAAGHDWRPATTKAPKTCRKCGKTEGEPLPAEMTNPYAIVENVDMTDTVLSGVNILEHYNRTEPLMAQNPDWYAYYDNGVLTFRGDNFRRNAAHGTAEIIDGRMTILWRKELGSLSTADSGVLYGVGWPGQPVIVKWAAEVRRMMNISEAKKETTALREVIFSAQDGKVYFLDLTDGEETRPPINIGYPLRSSVSVSTRGFPMISFGQSISKLKNKAGWIGCYLYNLVDQTELLFINGRQQDDKQKQYWTNGAFDGTGLMLWNNDALILAGENGLLYTVDLRTSFNLSGELTVDPTIVYQMSKSGNEPEERVGVESSVAMYNQYVYLADSYGIVRCVDTTSMKTVWAVDTGDNTDAALALDFDDRGRLWLYTGNTNSYRLGSKKDVSIRRLNAMTGEEDWSYQVACEPDNRTEMSGCKASPIIGQNAISHLVIFTVNMLRDGGSKVVALNKSTGEVAWEYAMSANAISSPVAVYNSAGDPWVIQGDQDGTLHLLDGRSGAHLSELKLDGRIDGSPAVYKNTLVIGTCSKGGAFMYGINLE